MALPARLALPFSLSLVLGGTLQQVVLVFDDGKADLRAFPPLAVCILLLALIFGAVSWRRRSASAIGWTAAAMLLAMLAFGVTVYIAGVTSLGPGIGGNIGYGLAVIVDFYFLLPSAIAAPIHWWALRDAAPALSSKAPDGAF